MSRPKMNHWYTPKLGLRTGIRVLLSSIFGTFADRRDSMALNAPVSDGAMDPAMDYSAEGGAPFWIDYMSDTGDGYDATFAMARLLCDPALSVDGLDAPLPPARVLVLGGDEVYPDPSKEEYQRRLIDPLEQATQEVHGYPERDYGSAGPDLYALPGNHDWYDGLVSFGHLFCRRRIAIPGQATVPRPGRIIANWSTQQTRSYFALKLPGNWWLWAVDSQLAGYIDKSQVEYFAYVGQRWMQPGANVILAVASPGWVGAAQAVDRTAFEQFDFVSTLAERVRDENGAPKGHRVRLVLTGDHHHYVRHEEEGEQGPMPETETPAPRPRTLIVAGGGGAFLHPTHHLDPVERHPLGRQEEKRNALTERVYRIASTDGREALYPPRDASRSLAMRNLWFALLNPGMTATIFAVYLLFIWTLSLWSVAIQGQTLLGYIHAQGSGWDALTAYLGLIGRAPLHLGAVFVSLAAYYYFAGRVRPVVRWTSSLLHWLAQSAGALLSVWFIMKALARPVEASAASAVWEVPTVILGAAVGALVFGTIFGLYLLIQLNVFGRHFNEAFSSIRIDQYRNFLRMKIGTDGALTVYPIGLRAVPGADEDERPRPEMIEAPIRFEP
ncbi:hypothetical protein [Tropicibacter sp. S64]|uniref:hypothetical protein n=1 Tax=Tropicibacter sp. S64 TaxID=3415122 RepID=UPI003C79CCA7